MCISNWLDAEVERSERFLCIGSVCRFGCLMDGLGTGTCVPASEIPLSDNRAGVSSSSARIGGRCKCSGA